MFGPERSTKPFFLYITIGRLQEPKQLPFSCFVRSLRASSILAQTVLPLAMNDFNVTEKSKLMEQVETFSLRSFFKRIHLMTALCSHKVSL